MDPTEPQLQALKAIVCHLIARHYREVIPTAPAGPTPDRQQSVPYTGRHEPRRIDAIVDAELQRAFDDPDPCAVSRNSSHAGAPASRSTPPG